MRNPLRQMFWPRGLFTKLRNRNSTRTEWVELAAGIKELIDGDGTTALFDSAFYIAKYPDIAAAIQNPLINRLKHAWKRMTGERQLNQPAMPLAPAQTSILVNGDLDPDQIVLALEYCLRRYARVRTAVNKYALLHYLNYGWREGRQPHPLFDGQYYLANNPDVAAAGKNPLLHYVLYGWREGRQAHPLFDGQSYLAKYPEVAGKNPLLHYLKDGWWEKRQAHPLFDEQYYLERVGGMLNCSPFEHYLREGWQRGLDPSPLFSVDYFLARDLNTEKHEPLGMYVRAGWDPNLSPHPFFDTPYYLGQNPNRKNKSTPLEHFLIEGWKEGHSPHPFFDVDFYLANNPDVAPKSGNPLLHFIHHGRPEGRKSSPHSLAQTVTKLIDEGDFTRAAGIYAAFSPPPPLGQKQETAVLPVVALHPYATAHGRIIREFPSETITVPKPNILNAKRDDLKGGTLSCLPAFVCEMKNVVVIGGKRVVITPDGSIIHDEVFRNQKDKGLAIKPAAILPHHRDGYCLVNFNRAPVDHIKEGIVLSCDHDENYFHWLVEVLPKLMMVDEIEELRKLPILVSEGLHPNLMRALDLINVHHHRIILLQKNYGYRVDRLICPSDVCRTVDRYGGKVRFESDCILSPRRIKGVAERIVGAIGGGGYEQRKLFLTRRSNFRAVENIDDLDMLFAGGGFDVETFHEVSFDYQVTLCQQAKSLFAVTGASFANIMFCRAPMTVNVMMSNHEGQNIYVWQQLATACGHELRVITGDRLYKRSDYEIHDDYRMDMKVVERAIAGDQSSKN